MFQKNFSAQKLKSIFKAEGVLLAKKAFNKKNFRDPKNEGSNLVKTYIRLTGVSKTHLFRIWQNFKMGFLGKRSAPSKEGLFLKIFRNPENGDSHQVKTAHLF